MSSQELSYSFLCVTYTLCPKVLTVTLNSVISSLEICVILCNYALPEMYRTFRDV